MRRVATEMALGCGFRCGMATHRSWLFHYTVGGRQRQMGLGSFPDVPLVEAREAAARCRASLRNGVDPIDHREQDAAGAEHRVPLSQAALLILAAMGLLQDGRSEGWVFPGVSGDKPLSNMSMIMLLRRMGRDDLTVHGFRSTFRDWCAELTNHPREIAEKALAHSVGDETERSYQRGDLLEKRRRLME